MRTAKLQVRFLQGYICWKYTHTLFLCLADSAASDSSSLPLLSFPADVGQPGPVADGSRTRRIVAPLTLGEYVVRSELRYALAIILTIIFQASRRAAGREGTPAGVLRESRSSTALTRRLGLTLLEAIRLAGFSSLRALNRRRSTPSIEVPAP